MVDSNGALQPTGAVKVNGDGTFGFTIALEAGRLGTDMNGRSYTITERGGGY